MTCTLCGSELTNQKDVYYFDCNSCSAIVKNDIHYLTVDDEKARYEAHNNDVNDLRYQNFVSPITDYVFDNFSPQDKGLDFGSGTGPVISSVLMKKNYNILQYDPFFAPDQHVLNNTFDYIVSCEVFEHFHNPILEIDRLVTLIKTKGALLIMTMLYNDKINFDTWHYRKDPTHVFIYRKETIEYIAHKMKLDIEILTDRFIVLKHNSKFS